MSSKLFINWVTIKPDPTWKRKKRKKKAEQVGLWGYVLTAYQQASRPSRAWRPVPTRLQASWHSQSVQIRTFYAPLGRSYTSTPLSYRLFGGYVFPRGATKGLGWRKMGLIFFFSFLISWRGISVSSFEDGKNGVILREIIHGRAFFLFLFLLVVMGDKDM